MLNLEQLENLEVKQKGSRCGLCANKCQLNIYTFNKKRYISGNRCDKPLRIKNETGKFNIYNYKYETLFDYVPLTEKEAIRGQIGIPRVLNMYEYFPFWFKFFTTLKFQVIISPRSNKKIYELGMQTIPSESLCYPAKLVNGHIQALIDENIKTIFYPAILYENKKGIVKKNGEKYEKKYACPIVTSYPEVIKSNMDSIKENNVQYLNPVVSFLDEKTLYKNLSFLKDKFKISKTELKEAINSGINELELYQEKILKETKKQLETIKRNKDIAVVLSGRPYHLDPEINHGIDELIVSQGMNVLSEDVVARLNDEELQLRVIDQWKYHSRLYQAANVVGKEDNLEMIQLNSFGCGIDAITSDQVKEIMQHYNKVYTGIKIDEGENLSAAKIRVRSLKATLNNRIVKKQNQKYNYESVKIQGDLKDYTLLAPQMSPFHFEFLESAAQSEGYNLKILPTVDKEALKYGVKYVHNDSCYPALVVIGQMIKAIENYDIKKDKLALLISQTGGGCRATNYIALLRKALVEAGYDEIPVVALNSGNVKDANSFPLSLSFAKKALVGILYGDALLRVVHAKRPYEKIKGQTQRIHDKWNQKIKKEISNGKVNSFKKNIKELVNEFDNIKVYENLKKPKVGIVGEILVKYHPTANNELAKLIEENGGEVVIPDFLDFFLYGLYTRKNKSQELLLEKRLAILQSALIYGLQKYRKSLDDALQKSKSFTPAHKIKHTAQNAQKFLNLANDTGEGWFLTGEMVNLLEDGVNNIVCTQPFGCLPNHVVGKGMFKPLKEKFPQANIVAIDYDPGASEVNQVSRIKLMMSIAKKNLQNN